VAMAGAVPLVQAACLLLGWRQTGGVAVTAALAALIALRHAANFGRIRAGTESRHGRRTHPEQQGQH
jgi:hypothetical protein